MLTTPGVTDDEIETLTDSLFSKILLKQTQFMGLKDADNDKKDLVKEKLDEYKKYRHYDFPFQYLS